MHFFAKSIASVFACETTPTFHTSRNIDDKIDRLPTTVYNKQESYAVIINYKRRWASCILLYFPGPTKFMKFKRSCCIVSWINGMPKYGNAGFAMENDRTWSIEQSRFIFYRDVHISKNYSKHKTWQERAVTLLMTSFPYRLHLSWCSRLVV